jgi:hypothetical protein
LRSAEKWLGFSVRFTHAAAFELIETQLGLDARRIELYQSFGIIKTKSNPPFFNANDQ